MNSFALERNHPIDVSSLLYPANERRPESATQAMRTPWHIYLADGLADKPAEEKKQ